GCPRWSMTLPIGYVGDAQLLSGNRILLAENQADPFAVRERDLTGKVVWEWLGERDFVARACRRLPYGRTRVASQMLLRDLSPEGVLVSQEPHGVQAFDFPCHLDLTGRLTIAGESRHGFTLWSPPDDRSIAFVGSCASLDSVWAEPLPNGCYLVSGY